MSLRGPDSITRGDTAEYECEAGPSNPVSEITWRLESHEGEAMDHLLQVSSTVTQEGEEGPVSVSRVRVSIPGDGDIVGLHVTCSTQAVTSGDTETRDKTISVHCEYLSLSSLSPLMIFPRSWPR